MVVKTRFGPEITADLLDAIRSLPTRREFEHCDVRMTASPFDLYADCPHCGARVKLRSFSGCGEVEDVFDAVFEWMNQPTAQELAKRRQVALQVEE